MGNDNISNRIREIIGDKDQVVFASELGIDNSNLSKYIKGKVKPGTDFYVALANKTNVNLNWLMTGKGEKYISIYNNQQLIEENIILREQVKKINSAVESSIINLGNIAKISQNNSKVKQSKKA